MFSKSMVSLLFLMCVVGLVAGGAQRCFTNSDCKRSLSCNNRLCSCIGSYHCYDGQRCSGGVCYSGR
uniref:Transferrin-like domain-containing protein n=1 Tax=Ditylenchus dipsaci TaxID=166011 RepID=A0A915CMA3_9BILA